MASDTPIHCGKIAWGVDESLSARLLPVHLCVWCVVDAHEQVGNAETEGYTMVVGVGATMVIYSAISSMADRILEVSGLWSE